MSKIKLYQSNDLHRLSAIYFNVISEKTLPAMEEELIVVQSIGMGRWLALSMAEKLGIWANYKFLFPNSLLNHIFEILFDNFSKDNILNKENLTWRIMKFLKQNLENPEFFILKNYLYQEGDLKSYQLSEKISDTFDQYLLYRPESLLQWDSEDIILDYNNDKIQIGDEDLWQPELWRQLTKDWDFSNRAGLRETAIQILKKNKPVDKLPARINVFGISTLPEFHLAILGELSEMIDVNFFILSPSNKYWFDIIPEKLRSKIFYSALKNGKIPGDLHYEVGNPLLASMGQLGQEFFISMMNHGAEIISEDSTSDLFVNPVRDSLLHNIQGDILNLEIHNEEKIEISEKDNSIVISNCHNPMREIEVLYDYLLDIMEKNENIFPRDILVMTSDIDLYSGYIESVFGSPEDEKLKIPYSIADRNLKKQNSLADIIIDILNLKENRFSLSSVLDILESPYIFKNFNIDEDKIENLSEWLNESGVRWGRDSEDRDDLLGVSYEDNSWVAGINRLILGVMMRSGDDLFNGISPYDNIEGTDSSTLGNFLEYINILWKYYEIFNEKNTIDKWCDIFSDLMRDIFSDDIEVAALTEPLFEIISGIKISSIQAEYDEVINFDVLKSILNKKFTSEKVSFGFLSGRVTFCAMLPMRSIPFKVVCMVGLNDTVFPRTTKPVGFDLIYKYPFRGDRSQRKDDRYLFLETIISVKDYLYISYIGQNSNDNNKIPPSVLVTELEDYISENYTLKSSDNIIEKINTMHRLQPYNGEYYTGNNKKYSYSESNFNLVSLQYKNKKEKVFINNELDPPGESFKRVSIDDLIYFYRNPTRYFYQKRLGMILKNFAETIPDKEHFDVDFSDDLFIEDRILNFLDKDKDSESLKRIIMAEGILPPKNLGKFYIDNKVEIVNSFYKNIKKYLNLEPIDNIQLNRNFSIDYNGKLESINVYGTFSGLKKDILTRFRTQIWDVDFIELWIKHIFINSLNNDNNLKFTSILKSYDKEIKFIPGDNFENIILNIIKNYWIGIHNPIKFFVRSSMEYMRVNKKNKDKDNGIAIALDAALKKFTLDFENPYVYHCYKNRDIILDNNFLTTTTEVLEPMFMNMIEVDSE